MLRLYENDELSDAAGLTELVKVYHYTSNYTYARTTSPGKNASTLHLSIRCGSGYRPLTRSLPSQSPLRLDSLPRFRSLTTKSSTTPLTNLLSTLLTRTPFSSSLSSMETYDEESPYSKSTSAVPPPCFLFPATVASLTGLYHDGHKFRGRVTAQKYRVRLVYPCKSVQVAEVQQADVCIAHQNH